MDNYKKSQRILEELLIDLPGLKNDTEAIFLTPAAQIRFLLPKILESFNTQKQILIIGCGSSCDKAVAFAEAAKDRLRNYQQFTQITSKRVEELWEPVIEGLNVIKVVREIPALAILLSSKSICGGIFNGNPSESCSGKRVFTDSFGS